MTDLMLTLWDLLVPRKQKRRPAPRKPLATRRKPVPPAPGTMAERYEHITKQMLAEHDVRVRKWRSSMSGVAWQVEYKDGSTAKLIESPRPKGPMSAAVFLHEIGHHAIGFGVYRPRCLEEFHAWRWSLEQMEALGLNITPPVRQRMHESLHYAIEKARRRGLKRLPEELVPYIDPPPARKPRA